MFALIIAFDGAVQQCRSTTVQKKNGSTVPKMKTLFNSAKIWTNIKWGNQKLNGERLKS